MEIKFDLEKEQDTYIKTLFEETSEDWSQKMIATLDLMRSEKFYHKGMFELNWGGWYMDVMHDEEGQPYWKGFDEPDDYTFSVGDLIKALGIHKDHIGYNPFIRSGGWLVKV